MQISFDPSFLVAFLFATIRCGAWLAIAPPFAGAVPARVRAGLSVALGLCIAPRLAAAGTMPTDDTIALVAGAFYQAAIGLALGFLVYVLFQAVLTAGSLIDSFSALTSAQMFDPLSKTTIGPMGRLYQTLGTATLFIINGHLILIGGLVRTFDAAPLKGPRLDRMSVLLTHDVTQFMLAAIQIAAPILAALFLTELLLGLASRAAPKLNVLVLGLGVKSLVLLMLGGVALPLIPYVLHQLLGDAMSMMGSLVR